MAHCPLFRVRVPVAPVKAAPEPDATCTSECLYGEEVTQLDSHEEWSHIRMHRDNYEGFVHNSALLLSHH